MILRKSMIVSGSWMFQSMTLMNELDPETELEEDTEGELAKGPPKQAEKRDAERRRDNMADRMWIQY
jgi:hypothetical protein